MVISSKVVKVEDFMKENPAGLNVEQLDGVIDLVKQSEQQSKAGVTTPLVGDLSKPHYANGVAPRTVQPKSRSPQLIQAVGLGILLSIFYLYLEYYAHVKYRMNYDLNDAFVHFWYPVFPMATGTLWIAGQLSIIEFKGLQIFQPIFILLESWAGGSLMLLSMGNVTFGDSMKIPGLGMFWAALTIQAELIPAAMGLLGSLMYYWLVQNFIGTN